MSDQEPVLTAVTPGVVASEPPLPQAVTPESALPQQQPWASGASMAPLARPFGVDSAGPIYSYPLNVAQGRVKGMVSDYRSGTVTLTTEAVYLDGKAVLPSTTRTLFLLLGIVLQIGWLLVAILLEYAIRPQRRDTIPWDCIDDIVLEREKLRVCLVYHLPDKPKAIFSLAFKPGASYFENFGQAARYFVPNKVREDKIGPVTSPWVYLVLGVIIVAIFGLIIWSASTSHR